MAAVLELWIAGHKYTALSFNSFNLFTYLLI
jgi:hypothetical protein